LFHFSACQQIECSNKIINGPVNAFSFDSLSCLSLPPYRLAYAVSFFEDSRVFIIQQESDTEIEPFIVLQGYSAHLCYDNSLSRLIILDHPYAVSSLSYNGKSRLLAVTEMHGALTVWNVSSTGLAPLKKIDDDLSEKGSPRPWKNCVKYEQFSKTGSVYYCVFSSPSTDSKYERLFCIMLHFSFTLVIMFFCSHVLSLGSVQCKQVGHY